MRKAYKPSATTKKGGERDLSGEKTPVEVETGLGETTITGSDHDDKITAGLGDDTINLGGGGSDYDDKNPAVLLVIPSTGAAGPTRSSIVWHRKKMAASFPGMAAT